VGVCVSMCASLHFEFFFYSLVLLYSFSFVVYAHIITTVHIRPSVYMPVYLPPLTFPCTTCTTSKTKQGSCRSCSPCGSTEYMVSECTAHADRVCAACLGLPACQHGYFREGCGNGNEGQCVPCRATRPGFYRVECGPTDHLLEGGHSMQCDECEAEYYRGGCGGLEPPSCLSAGSCKKCEDCGPDSWRNCGNLPRGDVFYEPGECKPCEVCPVGQYIPDCGFLTQVYVCVVVCVSLCALHLYF
jgi:hypothetical protein